MQALIFRFFFVFSMLNVVTAQLSYLFPLQSRQPRFLLVLFVVEFLSSLTVNAGTAPFFLTWM